MAQTDSIVVSNTMQSKLFLTANYTENENEFNNDFQKMISLAENEQVDALMIWEEYGSETHNHHWHGIMILKRQYRKRLDCAAKWIKQTAGLSIVPHVEQVKVGVQACMNYRLKDEKKTTWLEVVGEQRQPQFFRTDSAIWEPKRTRTRKERRHEDTKELLDQYRSMVELLDHDPLLAARLGRVADMYYANKQRLERGDAYIKPEVVWLYGATSTGKSAAATALSRNWAKDLQTSCYTHPASSLKWWDGYKGDQVVVVDDFRRQQLRDAGGFSYILRILDGYPLSVEIKGGHVYTDFRKIIITCAHDPVTEFTYKGDDGSEVVHEDICQLIRRIDKIIEFRLVSGEPAEVDQTGRIYAEHGLVPGGNTARVLRHSDILGIDII